MQDLTTLLSTIDMINMVLDSVYDMYMVCIVYRLSIRILPDILLRDYIFMYACVFKAFIDCIICIHTQDHFLKLAQYLIHPFSWVLRIEAAAIAHGDLQICFRAYELRFAMVN